MEKRNILGCFDGGIEKEKVGKTQLTKGFFFAIISSTPLKMGEPQDPSSVATKEVLKNSKKGVDKGWALWYSIEVGREDGKHN